MIAEPDGFMSVAIHAPASGIIRRIALTPSINGKMEPAFFLEPFAASTQEVCRRNAAQRRFSDAEQIIAAIQAAGVVGLGGAGFPDPRQTANPRRQVCRHAGHQRSRMRTLPDNRPSRDAGTCGRCDERHSLFDACHRCRASDHCGRGEQAGCCGVTSSARSRRTLPITVEVLPVKYPQGAEKMLITALLGREIPVTRFAGRRSCDLRQRWHHGGTWQAAAAWHGAARTGHHGGRTSDQKERQLSNPDRHDAAFHSGNGRHRRRHFDGGDGWSDDGDRSVEPGHSNHQRLDRRDRVYRA